ncbi:MAG: AAA family ATPase, partial [Pseudomonadota bacterium]
MTDFKVWLEDHGLGKHYDHLAENGIDMDIIGDLTDADLAVLDLNLGDRRRLMQAIAAWRAASQPDSRPTPTIDPAIQATAIPSETAERRQITLIFIDLVGSTQLSNTLDLDTYHDALNAYLNACTKTIRAHDGHLALLIGDGVVGYFGYPTAREDDAERAVRAGLEACKAVRDLPMPADTPLAVRVGISTGDVIVDAQMDDKGLALGEAPNLAARLQALADPGTVAISDRTRALLGQNFRCTWKGDHTLQGFDTPVSVWTVSGVEDAILRFEAQHGDDVTPIVNRLEEIEVLQSLWTDATDAVGRIVMLSGEAGIGKSRILKALTDWIGPDDCVRLTFQCSASHSQSAFYPIVSFLQHAANIKRTDSIAEQQAKLAALVSDWIEGMDDALPILYDLLSIPPPPGTETEPMEPEQLKARIRRLLVDIIKHLANRKPVLLLFEDLHWIDPSSEELLDLLIDELRDARVLITCTYRPDYEDRWAGRTGVTTLSVARLDMHYSHEMIRTMIRDSALSRKLERRIVDKTDGVPLFIEEMVRMVEQRAETAPGQSLSDAPLDLPSTLKDLLRAKIDKLGAARELVPLCATIGRNILPEMIQKVTGLAPPRVDSLLEQLRQAQILVPEGNGADRVYGFRHALIRDVSYDMMLASTARKLHRQVAQAMSEDFADLARNDPEVLAQHCSSARMPKEARDAWKAAATLASSRFATREAISHLTAAIDQNDKLPNGIDRDQEELSLRKLLAVALDTRAYGSQAESDNFEKMSVLLETVDVDPADAFLTLHLRFGAFLMRGDPASAQTLCPRMDDHSAASGNPTLQALAAHDTGMAAFMLGEFDAAIDGFDTAIALRERMQAADVFEFHASDIGPVDQAMRLWAK